MDGIKRRWVYCAFLLLQSCAATSTGTDVALQVVTLPLRVVGAAVGALIGAAVGMGYVPG